jgi:DNA-binding MarR family transcriptional regulator
VRRADLDWVKFDAELARDGSVDPVDKALYAALASFVDREGRESDPDPDGPDVPTRKVLAACIGRSLDTVDRSTKRLEARGLVYVVRRKDPTNPRRNIPSVYELLDHERWDERAAERAAARRAARDRARQATSVPAPRPAAEAPPEGLADPPPPAPQTTAAKAPPEPPERGGGGRMGAARGSRMGAARGSRTSAAGPIPSRKISLSEDASARSGDVDHDGQDDGRAPERESATPKPDPAQVIAEAWTQGTSLPRVPASEAKIRHHAAVLLAEGHDRAHLASVARWMAPRGWTDLGYALTAPGAPRALSAPSEGGQGSRPAWCGSCDERTRQREDETGRPFRCPDCHPMTATPDTLTV